MLITLAEVLKNIDDLPWDYSFYIPVKDIDWAENMKCMVLDPEEAEDPDGDPDAAKKNGVKFALTINCVQGVTDNLKAQGGSANLELKIKALKYYYDNDAYITLN